MKSPFSPTSIFNLVPNPILRLAAAIILSTSVFPQMALAGGSMCADIFMTAEMRAHEQKYESFVRTDNVENRLGYASSTLMLMRLRKMLPAGEYDVTVNHLKRDKLIISYAADGNITINLLGQTKVQTESRRLERGFWLAPNVSFGVDGRVQLLTGKGTVVSTTIIRGDEKTLAGLDRTDLSVEFAFSTDGLPTLTLTEKRSNWSIYRPQNQTSTTVTLIQPRG